MLAKVDELRTGLRCTDRRIKAILTRPVTISGAVVRIHFGRRVAKKGGLTELIVGRDFGKRYLEN